MAKPAGFVTVLLAAACSMAVAGAIAAEGGTQALPAGSSLGVGTDQPPPVNPAALIPQIGIEGSPALGNPAAPVTIVEFIDYECPYCQGFAMDTFPLLKANYIDTGRVRYVARDFPLPKHGNARPAAIAAACAREQGRFWEMHDALLTAGQALTGDLIARQAKTLALDAAKFAACRADARHGARLDAERDAAARLGVRGTPAFLVGASAGDVAKGRLLQGDEDYAAFEKILAGYLSTP